MMKNENRENKKSKGLVLDKKAVRFILFTAICLTNLSLYIQRECIAQTRRSPVHTSVKTTARSGMRQPGASASAKVNPQLPAYLTRLQNKLNKNWYLPDGNNHVTLTANVTADGTASDVVASGSPKNELAESSAMDAFNKSSPLEPLPSGLTAGKLTLKFDSTADPHGDSKSNVGVRFDPVSPQATPSAQATPANQVTDQPPAQAVAPAAAPAAAPTAAAPATTTTTAPEYISNPSNADNNNNTTSAPQTTP